MIISAEYPGGHVDAYQEVVACVSDSTIRNLLRTIASEFHEFGYAEVGPTELRYYQLTRGSTLFIEAGEDVALVFRLVYEIYMRMPDEWIPYIVLMCSAASYEDNPHLGIWEVNGHAAVTMTLLTEGDVGGNVRRWLDYCCAHPVAPAPQYGAPPVVNSQYPARIEAKHNAPNCTSNMPRITQPGNAKLIVCAASEHVRASILGAIPVDYLATSTNLQWPVGEWEPPELRAVMSGANVGPTTVMFVETGSDIALTVQLVQEIAMRIPTSERPRFLVFCSAKVIASNPSLTAWDIDGSPAVAALINTEQPDAFDLIPELLNQIVANM